MRSSAQSKAFTVFAFGFAAVAGVAIVLGLTQVETKAELELRSNDRQRTAGLERIFRANQTYFRANGEVADDLDDLTDEDVGIVKVGGTDPVSGARYGYEKISDAEFKVCATFQTESPVARQGETVILDGAEIALIHPAGFTCFTHRFGATASAAARPVKPRP